MRLYFTEYPRHRGTFIHLAAYSLLTTVLTYQMSICCGMLRYNVLPYFVGDTSKIRVNARSRMFLSIVVSWYTDEHKLTRHDLLVSLMAQKGMLMEPDVV